MTINRFAVVCLAIFVIMLAVLFLVSPQTSKWIYIFQSEVLQLDMSPPPNYEGKWYSWESSGYWSVADYKDGKMNGWLEQYSTTYMYHRTHFKDGERHGPHDIYRDYGLWERCIIIDDETVGEIVMRDDGTILMAVGNIPEKWDLVHCPPLLR